MTKQLNTELQEWFSKNQEDPADFFCGVMDSDTVKEKLLKLQTTIEQLNEEIARLRRQSEEDEILLGVEETKTELFKQEVEQLQQENNELNLVVSNVLKIAQHPPMDKAILNVMGANRAEKLAEHDKQTAIKAIEDMIENTEPYITNKGYQIREVDDILDYISQLKDS